MTTEYRSYLAANVLSDERMITYRTLSRALKVHVNAAKQMLFEFHRQQNVKRPGTVHATYLIAGAKRNMDPPSTNLKTTEGGEAEHVQSSPFKSSPVQHMEEVVEDSPVLSITLVGEENLEELRLEYDTITSIHIYSLALHQLKDLQVFSDAARETAEADANQDPLELARTYGTVINKGVKRRIGRHVALNMPFTNTTAITKNSGILSKEAELKDARIGSTQAVKPEADVAQSSEKTRSKGFEKQRNALTFLPQIKRESSNIFKSFAKAKPLEKYDGANSSAGTSELDSTPPSGLEDEVMRDTSEDEGDDYVPPPQVLLKEPKDGDKKSRKEREAALKKMMDDDDDDDDDEGEEEEEDGGEGNEESNIVVENQQLDSSHDAPAAQLADETVHVSDGRRRGRRMVMKKKTIQDDEGYLVTREELVWESFSEDEQLKTKSGPPSSVSSSLDKMRRGSSKAGQGSIMSFFGKK